MSQSEPFNVSQQFETLQAYGLDHGRVHPEVVIQMEKLDMVTWKKLEHYGMGLLLKHAAPDLPHFVDPESAACEATVVTGYEQRYGGQWPTPERTFSTAKDVLTNLVMPKIEAAAHTAPRAESTVLIVTIADLLTRYQSGEYFYDLRPEAATDETVTQLKRGLFGASHFLISALMSQALGADVEANDIDKHLFIEYGPQIRNALAGEEMRALLKSRSHLSMLSFMDKVHTKQLLSRTQMPLKRSAASALGHVEPIYSKAVGCPALMADDVTTWAPQILLSGCLALAKLDYSANSDK